MTIRERLIYMQKFSFFLLDKMKNSFFRSVIIFSILYGLVLSGCWEENQKNHKILDLKENEGIFNHIAYDLEDGLIGILCSILHICIRLQLFQRNMVRD